MMMMMMTILFGKDKQRVTCSDAILISPADIYRRLIYAKRNGRSCGSSEHPLYF